MGLAASKVSSNILLKAAVLDMSIQWIGCAAAIAMKTEKFYDFFGSSTFLLLTWSTLLWGRRGIGHAFHSRQLIQNACVSFWAIRLGAYLVSRILHDGEDRRFRKAKENPMIFATFWTVQGLWVWLTLLPTMILNMRRNLLPLGARDYCGWAIWLAGFVLQSVADSQKSRFRHEPENHGKFISSGLWSLSRHPNYLGEILMWSGLFLPASSVMKGKEFLSVVSPLFVAYLLIRVSGIPLLESSADRRWGHLKEYQDYKRKTACLVPFVW